MALSSAPAATAACVVTGKVVHKESARPLGDLLIEVFDLNSWADPESSGAVARTGASPDISLMLEAVEKGDYATLYKIGNRVGSVLTDSGGGFTLPIFLRDINLTGQKEQRPDLLLLVLAPDEPGLDVMSRLLHIARDVRFNAGSREAFIIRLPSAVLQAKQIALNASTDDSREQPADRVAAYIEQHQATQAYNSGVADFHGVKQAADRVQRLAFRDTFMKAIGADLSAAPPKGIVVTGTDNIHDKNISVVGEGVDRANTLIGDTDTPGIPVNLYLSPDDRTRLQPFFAGASGGFADVPDDAMGDILFRQGSSDNPGTILIHNNPLASVCASSGSSLDCAQAHTTPADASSSTGGGSGDPTPEPGGEAIASSDVPTYVGRLIRNMTSPDIVMQPELLNKRADEKQLGQTLEKFSLATGPAELPAFYDFNVLQIAFDHVWKQLFDEAIPNLAFTANAIGQSRFGLADILSNLTKSGLLGLHLGYSVLPVEVPAVVAKLFDITRDEYNEMSPTLRDQITAIATGINLLGGATIAQMRRIQRLTEQGERLVDSVRQDNYYTLHKTLSDLRARLTGKYDFTVFAADKDHHSVNFGLLNTYRQQWTPLTYQAGNLVSSIPLSPKEERRYSVKTVRNEKRSAKEARKNNTSITDEQSSTSRVEAEIVAKAQNKTNFSLTASGDYDIGISSGKATSTFGVDALSESAQNRKDFREAVLKAVQDYKQETTTEVSSESDFNAESTHNGTITNPNDELAVTYLFYELQKRYRISEQIYRVMPVVLVAQEVPSPDQITAAWVIANDWILNRNLLDDSFRETLAYLANKSVGDDFALRELRKNLRQQRSLVNTLQIEFSAASVEADNRYKALETAIASRIDEEHQEATDGFGSDLLQFFGGGGQDPEAAKARELAAKDAHQYAMEKAQKAAAALKEGVGNLHALTDNYNKTMQARLDNETKVERLLVHLRNNIFYYMQAIWTLEPPDQRFLRLYKVEVPVLELESRSYRVDVNVQPDIFAAFRAPGTEKHRGFLHGKLRHREDGTFASKPLVEVADLDSLLGFKGNYMIFPLREHNALTEFMAAPYVDSAFGAMDPDELANVSLDEYGKYVCCLHAQLSADDFDAIKPQLKAWLDQLLASPLRNGDEIVVPTGSLFIEALVDTNPILEDFKLKHREIDVLKTLEETRKTGLESLRLAARLLADQLDDPEIDKKVLIQGGVPAVVEPGP